MVQIENIIIGPRLFIYKNLCLHCWNNYNSDVRAKTPSNDYRDDDIDTYSDKNIFIKTEDKKKVNFCYFFRVFGA